MEAIIVAFIGLVGGVLVAVIQKTNKHQEKLIQQNMDENRTDHAFVMKTLTRVENKLDSHIDSHAKGEYQYNNVAVPNRKRKTR